MIIKEQDIQLTQLDNVVDNLGNIGLAINDGLKEQDQLLDDLDVEVDTAQEQLNGVMGKLQKLLNTKSIFLKLFYR